MAKTGQPSRYTRRRVVTAGLLVVTAKKLRRMHIAPHGFIFSTSKGQRGQWNARVPIGLERLERRVEP